jgi:hypothetical protein
MMDYEQISTEISGGVLTITLNRPDRLNAWTATMGRELIAAFDEADRDDDARLRPRWRRPDSRIESATASRTSCRDGARLSSSERNRDRAADPQRGENSCSSQSARRR